jgi:hypothetical protein
LQVRAREEQRKEGERRGEKKGGRGSYPAIGASGGGTHPCGDQVMVSRPLCCFQLEEEDNVHFARNPLDFVAFLQIFKAGLILLDLVNKLGLGKCEIIQGLPC